MTQSSRFLITTTAAIALVSVSLLNPSGAATKTAPKTTKKSKSAPGLKIAASATNSTAPTTTLPAKRSAGVPLEGWERIAETDWPAIGDAVVASAVGDSVDILRVPGDRNGALRLTKGRAVFGSVRLLALGTRDGYVRVALPIRPNESAGWVRSDEVKLELNTKRIVVNLEDNQLTVFDKDAEILRTTVAAGTGGTPTPTGLYFLKELVPQANPKGALGPFAFGLSAFSDKLFNFNGGQGVIGIHGTNAPGKLGENVSHGCIRMNNDQILSLTKLVGLGTPVEIVKSKAAIVPSTFRTKSMWLSTVGAPSAAPITPAPGAELVKDSTSTPTLALTGSGANSGSSTQTTQTTTPNPTTTALGGGSSDSGTTSPAPTSPSTTSPTGVVGVVSGVVNTVADA